MLISPAYAQAAGGSGGDPGFLVSLLPIVLIFAVFYFLLIRPQQKKMKQHREMVSNVRRGDRVVTQGGIVGLVTRVNDDQHAIVEIADGVRVKVVKATLSDVLAKGDTPGDDGDDEEPAEEKPAPAKRASRARKSPAAATRSRASKSKTAS